MGKAPKWPDSLWPERVRSQEYLDLQQDPKFLGWLARQAKAVDEVLITQDVPELGQAPYAVGGKSQYLVESLEIAVRAARRLFSEAEHPYFVMRAPEHWERAQRFAYYIAEVVRRAIEGVWSARNYKWGFSSSPKGSAVSSDPAPFDKIDIVVSPPYHMTIGWRPLLWLAVALDDPTGTRLTSVDPFGNYLEDHCQWVAAGRPDDPDFIPKFRAQQIKLEQTESDQKSVVFFRDAHLLGPISAEEWGRHAQRRGTEDFHLLNQNRHFRSWLEYHQSYAEIYLNTYDITSLGDWEDGRDGVYKYSPQALPLVEEWALKRFRTVKAAERALDSFEEPAPELAQHVIFLIGEIFRRALEGSWVAVPRNVFPGGSSAFTSSPTAMVDKPYNNILVSPQFLFEGLLLARTGTYLADIFEQHQRYHRAWVDAGRPSQQNFTETHHRS